MGDIVRLLGDLQSVVGVPARVQELEEAKVSHGSWHRISCAGMNYLAPRRQDRTHARLPCRKDLRPGHVQELAEAKTCHGSQQLILIGLTDMVCQGSKAQFRMHADQTLLYASERP